jgi:hypothetical protein
MRGDMEAELTIWGFASGRSVKLTYDRDDRINVRDLLFEFVESAKIEPSIRIGGVITPCYGLRDARRDVFVDKAFGFERALHHCAVGIAVLDLTVSSVIISIEAEGKAAIGKLTFRNRDLLVLSVKRTSIRNVSHDLLKP